MSTRNSLDRQSFEMFLANALAVQKSGLDTKLLSAVVEIQQFIAIQDLDLDQSMQKIADCLLKLFNASGVAMALLDARGLVYRAGAGSASQNVGQHVVAVLNVSSSNDVRREIVRVENAENDRRIEAEICRQFGAKSLLMLPICENHSLLGILQVLYDDAHAFTEREIRVYRLMVGALEEGMLRRLQPARKQEMTASVGETAYAQRRSDREGEPHPGNVNAPKIPAPALETNALQGEALTNKDDPPAVSQPWRVYDAVLVREVNFLWTKLRTAIRRLFERSLWPNSRAVRIALTAVLVLGMATWLINLNHLSTSTKGLSVALQPDSGRAAPVNSLAVKDEPNLLNDAPPKSTKHGSGFRRVVVGPNEVDYIADDVTIRHFTTPSPKLKVRSGVKEMNFGDDVTVRYFVSDAAVRSRFPKSPGAVPTTEHSQSAQQ